MASRLKPHSKFKIKNLHSSAITINYAHTSQKVTGKSKYNLVKLFVIFINNLCAEIKQKARTGRKTWLFSNPSKPLSNKCSLTMNPAEWRRWKQENNSHTKQESYIGKKKKKDMNKFFAGEAHGEIELCNIKRNLL